MTMPFVYSTRRIIVVAIGVLAFVLLAAPEIARAGGPPAPGSPFLTLPTPTPLPAAQPAAIPTPEQGRTRLYLPHIAGAATLKAAVATPTPTPAPSPTATAVPPTAVPAPATPLSDPHSASFLYMLRAGDTLETLAIEFGRDLRLLSCAVGVDGRPFERLQPGDTLVVPAMSDLCHRVKAGETVETIADWYGVTPETLLAVPENHLSEANGANGANELRVGQYLLIPDASSRFRDNAARDVAIESPRPARSGWRYGDGQFIWPVERSKVVISQGFRHGQHMALDLATQAGLQVVAADTGIILKAGWSDNGYGYHIVIDHGNDYLTLYAHLSEYYVQPGDIVNKGDVIGAVGSTGNSTGPHLHFEVRDYGYLIDPLLVLPK